MPPRLSAIAITAVLVLSACATGPAPRVPASRAPFAPGRADSVLAAAVQAIQERGYRVESCDAGWAALASGALETDTPCYLGSCLARQTVTVKLGFRAARVRLERQVWDYSAKSWVTVRDPTVEQEEAELLRAVVAGADVQPAGLRGDPCAAMAIAPAPDEAPPAAAEGPSEPAAAPGPPAIASAAATPAGG